MPSDHEFAMLGSAFYGLSYAFGIPVGTALCAVDSEYWSPLSSHTRRRRNHLDMAALNKTHFPKPQRIRALCQSMLNTVNKSDGPSGVNGGYDRRPEIRLEYCTGQSFGTLPQDDEYEDEGEDQSSDENSDDDHEDDDSGEWVSESDEEPRA